MATTVNESSIKRAKEVIDSFREDLIQLIDHRIKEIMATTSNRGDCDCQEEVKSTGQEGRTDSQEPVGVSKNVSSSSSTTSPTTGQVAGQPPQQQLQQPLAETKTGEVVSEAKEKAKTVTTTTAVSGTTGQQQQSTDLSIIDRLVKVNEDLQQQVGALVNKISSLEKDLSTIKEATKKRTTSYSMKDYEEYIQKNKDSLKKTIII